MSCILRLIQIRLQKTISPILSILSLYCFIVSRTYWLLLLTLALVTIKWASILYWMLRTLTLWHVEVAYLLLIIIIVINWGSLDLDLVKVYAVLRQDFTDYWFMLTHHLIWISVHNCISWIIQVIRNRWCIIGIKRRRICIWVPIWLNSSDKIKTLADIWLIGWHISIVLWTVTHCSKCSRVLICLQGSVVNLYLILLKPRWTIMSW